MQMKPCEISLYYCILGQFSSVPRVRILIFCITSSGFVCKRDKPLSDVLRTLVTPYKTLARNTVNQIPK